MKPGEVRLSSISGDPLARYYPGAMSCLGQILVIYEHCGEKTSRKLELPATPRIKRAI